MIQSFEPLDRDLLNLKLLVEEAKVKMESAQTRYAAAEIQSEILTQQTREARLDHERCIENNSSQPATCAELKSAWDEAKKEMQSFRNEYRKYRNEAEETKGDFNLKSSRYTVMINRYIEAMAPVLELQDRLMSLHSRITELYRDYARLEGATGQITWSIPWDKLLEDYRRLNSGFRVNWQRLPIKEAELLVTMRTTENGTELFDIPGVKSAVIPGAKPTGFRGIGSGESVKKAQLEASIDNTASVVFGNGISGQIVLNLMGACPYFDGMEQYKKIDNSELTKYMIANLTYTFEVAARRAYTASYNLSSLLRKIERKTKNGGIFSTSAAHSILEDNDSSDWFSISFAGNTSDFQYNRQEQAEITKSLKYELFDKAFRQFAVLNAGSAVPPPVPEFLDSGATTASSELRKCWHLYCQAGSAVLGIANSIWGRSNAASNFHSNNRAWVTERVNGIEFVTRAGSLTFTDE